MNTKSVEFSNMNKNITQIIIANLYGKHLLVHRTQLEQHYFLEWCLCLKSTLSSIIWSITESYFSFSF